MRIRVCGHGTISACKMNTPMAVEPPAAGNALNPEEVTRIRRDMCELEHTDPALGHGTWTSVTCDTDSSVGFFCGSVGGAQQCKVIKVS